MVLGGNISEKCTYVFRAKLGQATRASRNTLEGQVRQTKHDPSNPHGRLVYQRGSLGFC